MTVRRPGRRAVSRSICAKIVTEFELSKRARDFLPSPVVVELRAEDRRDPREIARAANAALRGAVA